jgi:hypothetical protein
MRRTLGIVVGGLVLTAAGMAQFQASVGSEQDRQEMLQKLHLSATRPGVSGSSTGPNPVNYDESKAGPFVPIPDPLVLADGKRVRTAAEWWGKRRPELLDIFSKDEYGFAPAHLPRVRWSVDSTERRIEQFRDAAGVEHTIPAVTRDLTGHLDNSSDPAINVGIEVHLTLPTQPKMPAEARKPVPVIIELAFRFPPPKPGQKPFVLPPEPPGPNWKQQILAQGWGYAEYYPTSVQADNGAGLREGVIGLVNKGRPRTPEQWGSIRAWAWGASRILDYLESDPAVNAKEVGIMGHSRFGKTALVAMAYDQRFAIGFISSSGAGGAALWRRNYGEQVENVASANEYHWMDGKFLQYAANPLHANDMPFDQDELIALCAPRPLFIGAGQKGDQWADPKGMFLAAVDASPVYRLLGRKGLAQRTPQGKIVPVTEMPPVSTALLAGDIGFRQHPDGHTPAPNWPAFIDFARKYWR